MELLFGLITLSVIGFLMRAKLKEKREKEEREKEQVARETALSLTDTAVEAKIDALARRRAQLMTADQYGTVKADKWNNEIKYFLETVVFPNFDEYFVQIAIDKYGLIDRVENATVAYSDSNPNNRKFWENMNHNEYEHYCAEELRALGWDARVTQASRDMGVDVIAERCGILLVIQCKLHRKRISNSAVQQISAARIHEKADYGAVVSNNSFTTDAQKLAKTNSILLLHHRDLGNINKLLGLPEGVAPEKTEKIVEFCEPIEAIEVEAPRDRIVKASIITNLMFPKIIFHYMKSKMVINLSLIVLAAIMINIYLNLQIVEAEGEKTKQSNHADNRLSEEHASNDVLPKFAASSYLNEKFTCKPKKRNPLQLITISYDRNTLSVKHKTKSTIYDVVKDYQIEDRTRDNLISWFGTNSQNPNLKIRGQIKKFKGDDQLIYTEELIDVATGKISKIEAFCR